MAELKQQQYVLIDMGHWSIALPQSEVVSVELLSDAICNRKGKHLVWWIKWQDTRVEIFALDDEANRRGVEDVEGNILVLLGSGKTPVLGLACTNIEVIDAGEVSSLTSLPKVMAKAKKLFSHLGIYQQELVCMSELSKLEEYLPQGSDQ